MEDQTNSLGVAARIRVRAFCQTIDPCHKPWRPVLMYLAVASISLAILVLTEPFLTIVWDEGYSLGREARVRAWFGALRSLRGSPARRSVGGLLLAAPPLRPVPLGTDPGRVGGGGVRGRGGRAWGGGRRSNGGGSAARWPAGRGRARTRRTSRSSGG